MKQQLDLLPVHYITRPLGFLPISMVGRQSAINFDVGAEAKSEHEKEEGVNGVEVRHLEILESLMSAISLQEMSLNLVNLISEFLLLQRLSS